MERPQSSPLIRNRSPVNADRSRTMSEVTSGSARGVRSSTLTSRSKSSNSSADRTGRGSRPTSSSTRPAMKRGPANKAPKELKKMDSTASQSEDDQERKEADVSDPKEKLLACLVTCLADCSRQRLRALHMSLRHCGNVDNRVTVKDMQTALQENQICLNPRAWALISELYENPVGLDYEALYICLVAAHLKTGRDSIRARSQRNDIEAKEVFSREAVDQDFVRRLEELLIKDHTFFDIQQLKEECSKWDQNRIGKMNKEGALLICSEKTPLYGALLKNLLERCDEDKDRKVSWPLLLNFLEKAQTQAWVKCPELATLPGKAKEVAAIRIATPDPIDELSFSARSAMTKLLKRAQKRRENSTDNSPDPPLSRESTDVTDVTKTKPSVVVSPGDGNHANASTTNEHTNSTSPRPSQESPNDQKTDQKTTAKPTHPRQDCAEDEKAKGPKEQKASDDPQGKKKRKVVPGRDITVAVPRNFHPTDTSVDPPQQRLQLEWIYGYRGRDCQRNLNVLANGDLIYFLSNIVIIFSTLEDKPSQRHYREHTEAIRCLALHSNGLIVATGQASGKGHNCAQVEGRCGARVSWTQMMAHVRLWRSDTLQTLHVLGEGFLFKTITSLVFMPSEDVLAVTDNSPEKKLTLWDTQRGTSFAETFVSTEILCDMTFNPKYTETLVTCGKEHLCWWKVSKAACLIQPSAQPKYEPFLKARFIYCLAHTSKGDLVTGDSNGTVYIWGDGGNSITNFIKHGHDGPVLSLCHYKNQLLTGGRDGCVRTWNWNKNMDCVGCLRLPDIEGGIRTVLVMPGTNAHDLHPNLVIGTTMHGLFIGELGVEIFEEMGCVTQGHSEEVKGLHSLCQSPFGADMVTASCDGVVCKLNTQSREVTWRGVFKGHSFTCVDATPDGLHFVLGTKDGHLVMIHLQNEDFMPLVVFNKKVTSSALNRVKFSPDTRMIAAAANDRLVHVFSLQRQEAGKAEEEEEEEWRLQGRCRGHEGPVVSVDWSEEMTTGFYVLKSCSSNPEQMYWNPLICRAIDGDQVCDTSWATHSCMLDHSLIGLWNSNQAKNSHVIGGDVNTQHDLVAMATDDGSLSLFRYPCCTNAAFSHTYKAHQRTERVCFTVDGRSLITAGGTDMSIMQWKLV